MAYTIFAENSASGESMGVVGYSTTTAYYGKGIVVKTGSHALTRFSVYVKEVNGSLSSNTYVARIYRGNTDYSTVGTLINTSADVAGSNIAVGWVNFDFSSPTTVVDMDYVVIEPKTSLSISTDNWIRVGAAASNADSGYSYFVNAAKHTSNDYADAVDVNSAGDLQYRAYEGTDGGLKPALMNSMLRRRKLG